jgi:hypothetical protein
VHLLVGTSDLDSIDDIEGKLTASDQIVLDEICTDEQKQTLARSLKADDQMAVTFGKIAFYCEIFKSTVY